MMGFVISPRATKQCAIPGMCCAANLFLIKHAQHALLVVQATKTGDRAETSGLEAG